MVIHHNPALRQEPRDQPIPVVPLSTGESILGWLERTGRLKIETSGEYHDHKVTEDIDDILDPEVYPADHDEEQFDGED